MTHTLLTPLMQGMTLPDDLSEAVPLFLRHHGHPMTAQHSAAVAAEARRLAERFGVDPDRAETGGWLHDISAVYHRSIRVEVAQKLGLKILPEELTYPMILHQKLSAVITSELFGVRDEEVLEAIRCHTTLRPHATPLDQVVFLADKIAWDREGRPPYLDELLAALDTEGLAGGCRVYLRWSAGQPLGVVHPWFAAALEEAEATPPLRHPSQTGHLPK